MKEQVLRFGDGDLLVGVLSEPPAESARDLGVVLLNAGLVHHAGPNRLWVQLARELAGAGFVTLRCDFSGIGDSPPRGDTLPFEQSAVLEARAALDALARRGPQRFALVGLCSGAEIAFKTACADERVHAAVLVNSPRYLVEPSEAVTARVASEHGAHYHWKVALKSPASWRRLLSGRADLRGIARTVGTRVLGGLRRSDAAETAADRQAFDALARRGVRLALWLSEGDWGQGYLRAVLGPDAGESEGRTLRVLPACDHLLTPLDSGAELVRGLRAWLASLPAPQGRG
jgi:alpha-beta hydrolase superfamily lysophospholipase